MFKRRGTRADGRPRFRDRRTTRRQAAGWQSRYRVVDETREHLYHGDDHYRSCVLTDLSMRGAGIHLTAGAVSVGDCVELDVPLGEHRQATIRVRGQVRHASHDTEAARAGLEFVGVGDLERALLLRLLRDLRSTGS